MFTTSVQPLAILLVALGLLLFVKVAKVGSRPDGLPPGPPTIPLLGNLHLVCYDKYLEYSVLIFFR